MELLLELRLVLLFSQNMFALESLEHSDDLMRNLAVGLTNVLEQFDAFRRVREVS